MTYGDNSDYQSLTTASAFAATLYDGNASEIDGYVFDLFQADVSLTLDPSFAAALPGGSGFAAVDAIATFDLSASVFNNLFFITVDSSDIDNVEGNDVIFSIDSSAVQYPFIDNGVSMEFSNSTIKFGAVNNQYVDQSLKKDVIRHIAKSITGGYAVADIFSNEAELIADVVTQDVSLHGTLNTAIESLKSITQGYTVDQINAAGITDTDQLRFFQVAQSLFGININDTGAGGRQEALFADLSNASVDANGDPLASVTVPLKFTVGDAIALRIQYDPNSSPVGGADGGGNGLGGMGNNAISSRSYKILIPLS